jgi:hypothetical protein
MHTYRLTLNESESDTEPTMPRDVTVYSLECVRNNQINGWTRVEATTLAAQVGGACTCVYS